MDVAGRILPTRRRATIPTVVGIALLRKYARLAANDPFLFLRSTCHLFYQDWHGGQVLDAAPRSWICGDLHLEKHGIVQRR